VRGPFIHKYRTTRNAYIFDGNTGRIVRVADVVWDILDDVSTHSESEVVRRHSAKYQAAEIHSAYEEVMRARERDRLFLDNCAGEIVLPSVERVKESLQHESAWVVLDTTEDCNFRCRYCVYEDRYGTWRKRSKRTMEWEVARRAIDDFLDHSDYYGSLAQTGGIAFYGGEPLLNFPLIEQCVAYVRRKVKNGPPFHVTTNGSLLTGKIAEFLASEGFRISISLDGPADIHDRCRIFPDGTGTWKVIMRNLQQFLEKYPEYEANGKLSVNTVLTPEGSVLAIERSFGDCGALAHVRIEAQTMVRTHSSFSDSFPAPNWQARDLPLLYQQFLRNLASGAINADPNNRQWRLQRACCEALLGSLHAREVAPLGKTLAGIVGPRGTCMPGVLAPHVTVDGSYYPCEKFPCRSEFKIGSVWHGRDPVKIHDMIVRFYSLLIDQCASCWCSRNCRIGCYAETVQEGALSEEAKRKRCERYRLNLHNALIQYAEILEQNPHAFEYLRESRRTDSPAAPARTPRRD
jgi:uncharacterized protein